MGNGAIPVWPVASNRSLDMLIFAQPDARKRTANSPWQTHTTLSIDATSRLDSLLETK
jgi:hypothetical protein